MRPRPSTSPRRSCPRCSTPRRPSQAYWSCSLPLSLMGSGRIRIPALPDKSCNASSRRPIPTCM
ncbi:MAG: hypothetical protein D6722_08385 [Bacteroidetes bacterium]|nr:MAG: hypothetical protein D6722_08385 [Bacteroidota bacterium]